MDRKEQAEKLKKLLEEASELANEMLTYNDVQMSFAIGSDKKSVQVPAVSAVDIEVSIHLTTSL